MEVLLFFFRLGAHALPGCAAGREQSGGRLRMRNGSEEEHQNFHQVFSEVPYSRCWADPGRSVRIAHAQQRQPSSNLCHVLRFSPTPRRTPHSRPHVFSFPALI